MSSPIPGLRSTLRSGASRLVLAAGLLVGAASLAGAEEPRTTAQPQVRGLAALQERTALAALPRERALPVSVVAAGAAADVESEGISDDLKSAYACLIGGSVALATSLAVGGENLTNLIAGGVVVPQNQTVLYIALVGVVFAAFCSISESLLPIYTYHFEGTPQRPPAQPAPAGLTTREAALPVTVAPERVTFRAGVLGGAATGASRRMGATAFANLQRQPDATAPVLVAQER
jgi:hypothetical protein